VIAELLQQQYLPDPVVKAKLYNRDSNICASL
jgi:hypothetical protein